MSGAYETLAVELDGSGFRAIVYGAEGTEVFAVPLDKSIESPLQALEEAVYSSEALTADYSATRLFVRTLSYSLSPATLAEAAGALAHIADTEYDSIVVDPCRDDVSVVWAMAADCLDFLRRTFRNAPVRHVLSPLSAYFAACCRRRNSAKIFVHLNISSEPWADIAVYDSEGSLMLIVSRPAPTATDTLYYIVAAARQCNMDIADTEINICGDAMRRNALMELLGRYAANVMPMPYPATALEGGIDPANTPLPLIV